MLIKFNLNFKYLYYNNNLQWHRLDGPSYENNGGDKWWYKNGKSHREDGPAIEWIDHDKFYYFNNVRYSEKEYWTIVRFKGYL